MILRRLTKHMNEQNWIAVFLDLIVVIVGIYLGMQASDWSQSQADYKRETEYLVRLRDDFSKNTQTLEETIRIYDELRGRQARVLKILARDVEDIGVEDLDVIGVNLMAWAFWRQVDLELGTVNELISSGEMKLVRDEDIRHHLITFHAANETIRSQLNYFRDWFLATKSQFMYAGIELTAQSEHLGDMRIKTDTVEGMRLAMNATRARVVDVGALKGARSITGLTELYVSRSIMTNILEEQAVRSRETYDLLNRAIGKTALQK